MNCEEARSRIQDRIDERCDDPALDAHVATCGECGRYAEQMYQLTAALGELGWESEKIVAFSPTPSLRDHHRRTSIPRPVWRFVRVARVAVVLAILVTGSAFLMPFFRDGEQPTMPTAAVGVSSGAQEPGHAARVDPRVGISLRGKSRDGFLPVAVTTKEANVQMYWLYPVLKEESAVDPSW